MAYLTQTIYRSGEKGPLATTATVVDGTGTIEGIEAGCTFTLLDALSIPVPSMTNIPIVGNGGIIVAADNLSASVYVDLDASMLPPNLYYGIFTYTPQTSDNVVRIVLADVQAIILPLVETIATFDPSTVRGRVRMELQDISDFQIPGTAVGITAPIFADYDVDRFILQANSSLVPNGTNVALTNKDLYRAAYYGWINIAAEKATLVKVKSILFIKSSTMPTYQAALQQANEYLKMSNSESGISVGRQCDRSEWEEFRSEWNGRVNGYWPNRNDRRDEITNW